MQQPVTATPPKGPKSTTIQLFRGVAILGVILSHTCPEGMWSVVCRPLVNICVPLFLFFSGYLTKIENTDWATFFKKRIVRVVIPYLIWTVIYTIQTGDLKRLPVNILTTNAASHLYYIFVYIQFVLLTPMLGKLAKSKYGWLVWFITPVFLLFYKYLPLSHGKDPSGYTEIICRVLCLGWVTIYSLGLALGNRILVKKYSMTALIALYAASIVLQVGEGYGWLMMGSSNPGSILKFTGIVTAVAFLLIVYTILERGGLKRCNRLLVMIGDYSFGLYLCHVLVMRLLRLTPFYDSLPYLVNSALVLVISLAFCFAAHKILGDKASRWVGIR